MMNVIGLSQSTVGGDHGILLNQSNQSAMIEVRRGNEGVEIAITERSYQGGDLKTTRNVRLELSFEAYTALIAVLQAAQTDKERAAAAALAAKWVI